MTEPMAHGSPFTCTFCRGVSAGPPRVLGRSARLACEPCHSALLNLSICWVCGEMIVRGDECVSLGWCFWHRACYGCLLCGCRRVCSGVPPSDVDDNGSSSLGREVAEAPLCAMCVIDVEADGMDEQSMMQKGLRRISLVDGGVTRRRWLSKLRHGKADNKVKRVLSDARLELTAVETQRRRDEASSAALCPESTAVTTIWVDIHDPVNGSSFIPAPLKPVPPFMSPPAVERR
ncbi:hypothetical protein XA68_12707 [Ophiocordyceps unilateralis]|uniref:LIM zinc-binding domain-containing protein n=1 Tax=Ophiocordyceps unilateralis TaxID=268505 RepID=A0A2A9PP13_OPHUN|nr:hypothetical protein XA68_12707 [Ophiocordyceps unilateralis]